MPNIISKDKIHYTINHHFGPLASDCAGAGLEEAISDAMYCSTQREMIVPITRMAMLATLNVFRFVPVLERRNFAALSSASSDLNN